MAFFWDNTPQWDRFDPKPGQATMKAIVTMGNGGYDKLHGREVSLPTLKPGEVLLQVLASGVNNTEINTRIGWYSSAVTEGTAETAEAQEHHVMTKVDGGWNEATPFPFIQGTDCCGRIVAMAPGENKSRIGARVLVRACMRKTGFGSMDNYWMGSDFDGAFAQYVKVPASEIFPVNCTWSNAELATIPCAYGTAENMIHRGKVGTGEHVLVTGASGGVGSAVVQLAKRRGATVTAVAAKAKAKQVLAIGADRVIDRDDDVLACLGKHSVDIVIDNVAGAAFEHLLKTLKRGGRYASSGAIGGPRVALDLRTMYLNDLCLIGSTAWDAPVFPNIISYIERGELQPLIAQIFPLEQIADAQRAFLEKKHVGNFVLIPPPLDNE